MEHPLVSNALEVVERLEAIAAPVLGLAWRRAELAHPLGVLGLATGAGDHKVFPQKAVEGRWPACSLGRRRDAIGLEPLPSFLGDPVSRPGRREPALDPQAVEPFCTQSGLYLEGDDARCRAARVSGRDRNDEFIVLPLHVA